MLRVGVAMEFAGHGAVALGHEAGWIPFVTLWGFSAETAPLLMTAVGALDIALAALILLRPMRGALMWMAFWGLFTALLRPLTGLSLLAFIERGANWAAPLALLLMAGWPKRWKDLWSNV